MADRAGWIDVLFKRFRAAHALRTGFLLDHSFRWISEEADARPGGRAVLREAALGELGSDDDSRVAMTLLVLAVVGKPQDARHPERLEDHPSPLVRRAARACRFRLGRLPRK